MKRIRDRLAGERGSILAISMGVLSTMLILSAGVAATSMQLNNTSNSDRSSKRALQAADAGLQVALFRLNNLDVAASECVTTQPVTAPADGCNAPSATTYADLGNGTSYRYNMTAAVAAGTRCAGVAAASAADLSTRCITVIGLANGVQRRVQARITSSLGTPLFPNVGMMGYDLIELEQNPNIQGSLGSNHTVDFQKNGAFVRDGVQLGYSRGAVTGRGFSSNVNPSTIKRTVDQGDFEVVPVQVGNSATVNSNTTRMQLSGGAVYTDNAGTGVRRELTMNSGTAILTGGTYNFCNITMGNNARIEVAAGQQAQIFIDSPSRTGSGCRAGTGNITDDSKPNNNFDFVTTGPPESLQLYMVGAGTLNIKNNGTLKAAINAPFGTVVFKNNASMNGALAANVIDAKGNFDFTYGDGIANLRGLTSKLYRRSQWRECRAAPTVASDPRSGC